MALTPAERSTRWRRRQGIGPRMPLQPCGTVAAARRHERAGEPVCAACREALRQHSARMNQQRRTRNK